MHTFLDEVRKDIRNPKIHMQFDLWVFFFSYVFSHFCWPSMSVENMDKGSIEIESCGELMLMLLRVCSHVAYGQKPLPSL